MKKRIVMHSAFTLVELLVVIAIISVLAAMLMPALEQALGNSRSIECLSNQKQLFVAFSMYFNDYDGRMFVSYSEKPQGGSGIQWYQEAKVGGYLGLPDPTSGNPPQGPLACSEADYTDHRSNYAVVREIFGSDWGKLYYRINHWQKPQYKICTFDSKAWYTWAPFATVWYGSYRNEVSSNPDGGAATFRHMGGHNVVFLDGHGKWFPEDPDDVVAGCGWMYRGIVGGSTIIYPTDSLLTAYCFQTTN